MEQAGKYDANLKWLKQAAQIDLAYPTPHYIMAQVYRRIGKLADARREMADFKALQGKAPQVCR